MDILSSALTAAAQQLPPIGVLLDRIQDIVWTCAVAALAYAFVAKLSYGHKRFDQQRSGVREQGGHVVQVDDLGLFWDPAAATAALNDIAESARRTNTIVVVFIHGWHHNANVDDRDVVRFAESIREVKQALGQDAYRRSRQQLTGDPGVVIKGVYIGWRGRSLPGYLDFLTFWTRKAAAERVGEGDLRDFLVRLQNLYTATNATTGDQNPFMGLVSIGHSFGGQALFKAVEASLESQLVKAAGSDASATNISPVSGFGDLVVLLNPALEALQYQTIHELNRRIQYDASQAPILIVLSATTDFARIVFFPLGRILYTFFSPWLSGERLRLSTQALGAFAPQRTHKISVLPENEQPIPFDPDWYVNEPERILQFDLSDVPNIARLQLERADAHRRHSPFLVAHVDGTVVVKHSGIYKKALRDFLVDYIAITQGKRILARRHKSRS